MAPLNAPRRKFLGGLLAAGLIPQPTWADAGAPVFLSAAASAEGAFFLCGIDAALQERFRIPLPSRGHAAAAHPTRPEAVAFARRPGTFAVVIDCVTGQQRATLHSPQGRHFYGHGTFSADGKYLFTTENDYEAGQGRIGVWDATRGYRRIDEWASGGIGPHDIKRLANRDTLVVANGGIDTHPDSGRTKLNISTMRPNLAYIEGGEVVETASLPDDMHKNSIRHLAVDRYGTVAFGMQWQGDTAVAALVGTHQRGRGISLMKAPAPDVRALNSYIGSIAYSDGGHIIAVTSPRGGVVQFYDAQTGRLISATQLTDVSGVFSLGPRFAVTSGTGEIHTASPVGNVFASRSDLRWDNHLVPITS
ncbi:DUF1513 domain-containing protein [Sulfitobacter sp. F26169L]|uniref:DUF1513 domain-containing protein n=1 Tax=Sulfitobacter sp. F26169L TaxID=2996015 RepID=UPI00226081AC|nr:DUF1513 domain-containing protein [Sulfitobacter sp. F26169L]MCX7566363.1 DUF1513 domain-containing protein [Sulfitobacter sp. F26169L]